MHHHFIDHDAGAGRELRKLRAQPPCCDAAAFVEQAGGREHEHGRAGGPLMRVALTPGAFDDAQKARLAAALTEAACRAESVPDEPGRRMRALVLFEELAPGCFYSAGQQAEAAVAVVFVDWQSVGAERRDPPPAGGGARLDGGAGFTFS
ncbi:tautomerase family protein [Nocardia sp. CA-119907]|uniref:tautomerase family protein n=1 Tax=Nocardia sp. CA-119907 TaxID=3239973 RepID=UPI003D969C60